MHYIKEVALYFFDSGALSAISAFQSLNKLSPLVADFKMGFMNSVYALQDQLSQISAHLD